MVALIGKLSQREDLRTSTTCRTGSQYRPSQSAFSMSTSSPVSRESRYEIGVKVKDMRAIAQVSRSM